MLLVRCAVGLLAITGVVPMCAQTVSLKTNLLYLATTTPNLGLEWRTGKHFSLGVMAGYNPLQLKSYQDAAGNQVNPKLHHWLATTELRYWPCEAFLGWSIGVNAFGGAYNAGGIRFIEPLKEGRYKGWAAGGGITVGYQFPLSVRWSLDLSVGAGYLYTRYNRYDCYACGENRGEYKRNYLGPSKAAVSLVYWLR